MGRHYTPHDDEVIRNMWAGDYPAEVIADRLHRDPGSIRGRIAKLGLPPHRSPDNVTLSFVVPPDVAAVLEKLSKSSGLPLPRLLRREVSRMARGETVSLRLGSLSGEV